MLKVVPQDTSTKDPASILTNKVRLSFRITFTLKLNLNHLQSSNLATFCKGGGG